MITEKTIRDAYIFLRQNNNTIPDETLDFMLHSSIEKLKENETTPDVSNVYEKDIKQIQKNVLDIICGNVSNANNDEVLVKALKEWEKKQK